MRRSKVVAARVTPWEHSRLLAEARRHRVKVATLVRQCIYDSFLKQEHDREFNRLVRKAKARERSND